MVHDAVMAQSWQPTWKLVLDAAEHLSVSMGEFRLQDLVAEVQRVDPARGRGTIQPTVQGMTINAGTGPPSPCGKPLRRTSHGWYALADGKVSPLATRRPDQPAATAQSASGAARGYASRDAEVAARLAGLIETFTECVAAYDRLVPFLRSGQYQMHRATIDRRNHRATVGAALEDDEFLGLLYQTLRRWGIGIRGSRLVPLAEFRSLLRAQACAIAGLEGVRIDDPTLDVPAAADAVWEVIKTLNIVSNISVIVPGTKTMHHLLPDLVPPMDRAWTGAFFLWSATAPQHAQAATFKRTFASFARIARDVGPNQYVGTGWRTSRTKVLDNALIDYCKINNISPARA
jgi:hypothetical protein